MMIRTFVALALLLLSLVQTGHIAWAQEPVPASTADTSASAAVILMYHRVGEKSIPSTNITIEQFTHHIQELQKDQFTVLPLADIVAALKKGRPLPDRSIAITFDDAYLSIYENAWPILKRAGLPFTLFVATEPIDLNLADYINWDQLKEMAADPLVTIGHHGHSHHSLLRITEDEVMGDLLTASARFEAELGYVPALFAYPFGEYDNNLMGVMRKLSFTAALAQFSSVASPTENIYALPRFALNENYGDMDRFRLIVNALALPAYDVLPLDSRISDYNPPAFGFSLQQRPGNMQALSCYPSHMNKASEVILLGDERVEVRFDAPLPEGRSRINCTLPGPNGRWYWLGRPFFNIKNPAATPQGQ